MKGIGNKAVKFSLALVLVLSIGLIPAMPTAQASVNNTVNMDFFKAYIHSTESNFVGYDESLPAGIMTGTGLHNQAEDPATGESVVGPSLNGGPLLTFTPGDVGITELEMQGLRPESEYIWDLYPILENEGRGRSVGADLEGVSFQPGYTVDRTLAPTEFSGPGTYTQTLDIYTTPAESMMELVIVVQIPDNPQLTATITSATGDGITPDNWSANGAEVSIPAPDTGIACNQTFTIEVEVPDGDGSVSFKPEMQVIAWYNVPGGTWETTDYTVTRTIVLEETWTLGTWTWDTSEELYDRHYNEQLAKVVHFPGSGVPLVNQGNVSFTTGQNCNTMGDVVENVPQTALDWINSWLCNPADDSEAPVTGGSTEGGPVLSLNYDGSTVEIRHAGGDGLCSLSEGPPYFPPIDWGFHALEEDNCWHGYAEFGDVFDFQPGFEAIREANTKFPSTGGTQFLTLQVIPKEYMERLDINGSTQVGELADIATVTNVEIHSSYTGTEGLVYEYWDNGFWIGIDNPIIDKMYEIEITIDIDSVYSSDPSVEIVFMPFIQVRNIVAVHDSWEQSGLVMGDSIVKDAYGGSGTWTWQAVGDYQWNWAVDEVKEANLEGYSGEPPWENNIFKFETHNWHRYTPPGDIFINDLVDGSMFWGAGTSNEQFASGQTVTGLTYALESDLDFTWYPVLAGDTEIVTEPDPGDQSTYEWSFSDVGVGGGVNLFLHPFNPEDSYVAFEPGFDVVRWVDISEFAEADGTQTQKLTIVITPREDYNYITNNILVQIAADENSLIPTNGEYASVEAVINPVPEGSGFVMDDGHLLVIPIADWQTGKPITLEAEVEVTPLEASVEVEYVPTVWVSEVVESMEYHDVVWGNTFEPVEQPFLGTWTVTTDTEQWLWWRTNVMLKGVTFSNVHPGVETFNIESMFVDFGEGSDLDEITITEALFDLAEDSAYDLINDDVTVIVDGVPIVIPGGSFNSIEGPSSERYIYNSKGTESAKVQMVIDFSEGQWSLIVRGIDAGLIDNSDGVTVVFAIGNSAAIERIYMQVGGLSYTAGQ